MRGAMTRGSCKQFGQAMVMSKAHGLSWTWVQEELGEGNDGQHVDKFEDISKLLLKHH